MTNGVPHSQGKHHKDGEEEKEEEGGDKAPKEASEEKTSSPQVKAKKEHKKSSKKTKGTYPQNIWEVGEGKRFFLLAVDVSPLIFELCRKL